jgi:three-Cys-motif partner protein
MNLLAFTDSEVISPAMGQKFFDEREDQSEVKARIVSKYFIVWAKIIAPKARTKRIGYIDLFAGPGRYKDGSASTPIMVLQQAIADSELRDTLVTYFNDEHPEHTKSLQNEINALPNIATLRYAPQISTGDVGAEIAAQSPRSRLLTPSDIRGCRLVWCAVQ